MGAPHRPDLTMVGVVPTSRPPWINRLDDLHLLTPLRILAIIIVAIVVTVVLRSVVTRLLSRTLGLPGTDRSRADARQRALASALRSAVVGVVWAHGGHHDHQRARRQHRWSHRHGDGHRRRRCLRCSDVDPRCDRRPVRSRRRSIRGRRQVDLGFATGEVERITLRSVRLRDGEGRVWHVAHGNVMCVANLSKSSRST